MANKLETFKAAPGSLVDVCEYVADGGSLITFCKSKSLRYSAVINWIYADEDRQKSYETALEARGEWVAQRLLAELQRVGFADVRKLFNDDGSIKEVSQLDDETAAIIGGIDIQEAVTDKDGEEVVPRTRKIKVVDKLKALEMLGKHLKMFTDKHEVSGALSLEDLVTGSLKKPDDSDPKAEPEKMPDQSVTSPEKEEAEFDGKNKPESEETQKDVDAI